MNSFIEEKPETGLYDMDEPVLKTSVLDLFAGVDAIPAPLHEAEQQSSFGEPVLFNTQPEQAVNEEAEEAPKVESPFAFELKVEEPAAEPEFDFTAQEEQEIVFESNTELETTTEFTFETTADAEAVAEITVATQVEEKFVAESTPEISFQPEVAHNDDAVEEQLRKSRERIMRLKDLSMKLRTANGLQELENEPAYKRKQMSLDQVPHSSESQVSRFTLSNEEGITEIRPNNSFLHDNVD